MTKYIIFVHTFISFMLGVLFCFMIIVYNQNNQFPFSYLIPFGVVMVALISTCTYLHIRLDSAPIKWFSQRLAPKNIPIPILARMTLSGHINVIIFVKEKKHWQVVGRPFDIYHENVMFDWIPCPTELLAVKNKTK